MPALGIQCLQNIQRDRAHQQSRLDCRKDQGKHSDDNNRDQEYYNVYLVTHANLQFN
jgi:hypothetical protein